MFLPSKCVSFACFERTSKVFFEGQITNRATRHQVNSFQFRTQPRATETDQWQSSRKCIMRCYQADQSQLLRTVSPQSLVTFLERCASAYGVVKGGRCRICVH
ncbi:hypothetical protein COCON_G00076170 [Conger conger]|uniref:Uncharacterized protein n=1 Tax=Conger conger TaxID=82655 RepID=A0A9Q1DNP3_CONCO|nr:hypothetical protein COCON_G00076170 [Conger conger]